MLNDAQYAQLLKPLNPSRIAKRSGGGKSLSYLEAWDVKAHLIRIFGFGGWSWNVTEATLAFEDEGVGSGGKANWSVGYKVIGTLTVHDLDASYTEAAVGFSTLPTRGEAHDMAIKTAESDALKRASINLGDQFGLSLYNNGKTAPVVVQTLDGDNTVLHEVPVESPETAPEGPSEPPADTEGAGIWIESMKAAVEAKDVPLLLELKKQMNEENVNDWLYQGVTLNKWLDRAIAGAGKN